MRIADIDYDFELPDGTKIMLTVMYGIDLEVEGRGTEDINLIFRATPQEVQVMIGGMPFGSVEWADIRKDYPLHDRIRALASEVTPESCGYTRDESLREACEEEDDREEESRQIGRPV